jgi:enolase
MQFKASEIKNSRGESTIEVSIHNFKGSAPSGASTGKKEVKAFNYPIKETITKLNKINLPKIDDYEDLEKVESLTTKLGSSATIALEFAILQSKSGYKWINKNPRSFPMPLGNVVGGGAHSKAEGLEFQEFLLISPKAPSFFEAAFANLKIHKLAQEELERLDSTFKNQMTDEGAWAPTQLTNEQVLDVLDKIVKKVSKEQGFETRLGLDVASSQFYKAKYYHYKNKRLTREQQISFISDLINKYNLYYVEDPLIETDFEGFAKLKKLHKDTLICGDDLICTNPDTLKEHIDSVSAVIVKPNQIGSLIRTRDIISIAKKHSVTPVISHRSGETLDNSISHLALGFQCPIIKCGIFGREREAKIKELIRIEKSK